jgi:hypothetical protein
MVRNKQNSGKRSFCFPLFRARFVAIVGGVWFQARFGSAFTDR